MGGLPRADERPDWQGGRAARTRPAPVRMRQQYAEIAWRGERAPGMLDWHGVDPAITGEPPEEQVPGTLVEPDGQARHSRE